MAKKYYEQYTKILKICCLSFKIVVYYTNEYMNTTYFYKLWKDYSWFYRSTLDLGESKKVDISLNSITCTMTLFYV